MARAERALLPDGRRPVVLITGGSEGIGLALARRFGEEKHDLVLVARDGARLAAAAEDVRRATGVAVTTIAVDLTRDDAIATIEAALAAEKLWVEYLVNNAGIGLAGDFSAHEAGKIDQLVALNVAALTRLCRHYLPEMRRQRRGGILNVASLGGLAPGPYQSAYYASKAYVISLSEALASEVWGDKVRVAVVAPGPVRTDFHEKMGGASGLYLKMLWVISPETVARAAYRGLMLGQRLIVPGVVNMVTALLMRITPHRISNPIVAFLLRPRR